jgi:predicted nucleic acid-binding protein
MTTAIDSNLLIDVIGQPNEFTDAAIAALDAALGKGALLVCPVVVAETAGHFPSEKALRATFHGMHLELRAFDWLDLHRAGEAYLNYCRRSRPPKQRMLADFLVAAHAFTHADALLTRDRGYYRSYFPKLALIEP